MTVSSVVGGCSGGGVYSLLSFLFIFALDLFYSCSEFLLLLCLGSYFFGVFLFVCLVLFCPDLG